MTAEPFGGGPFPGSSRSVTHSDTSNLADILERVLDKGVVVAGDIVVSLVDVELLTIRLRLLIASVDKAKEMGINWWENDGWLTTSRSNDHPDVSAVSERLERLEATVGRLASALDGDKVGR